MAHQRDIIIEHQCPQCGAPAVLEETDHLFSCQFCRVKSFLFSGDYFRYVISHEASADRELVHVPYWRFKGSLFSALSGAIRHRIVDVTSLAAPVKGIPPTLGLRPQTLTLRFIAPDMDGLLADATVSSEAIIEQVRRRFSLSLPGPVYSQAFIGETTSLIYAPCYYKGDTLVDAVLNTPLSAGPISGDFSASLCRADWKIGFIPALCPGCGWDLDGRRDSIVLECRNCNSLWMQSGGRFTEVEFGSIYSEDTDLVYLPFYRIAADVLGLELSSYADLVRVANLPRLTGETCSRRPFYFWSPAFKVRPQDLLRLAGRLTVAQPDGDWRAEVPSVDHHPVTLPLSEAVELAKVTLASFAKPPFTMRRIAEASITPRKSFLAYLPFKVRTNELYQQQYKLRLNSNLLVHARHL